MVYFIIDRKECTCWVRGGSIAMAMPLNVLVGRGALNIITVDYDSRILW